MHVCAQHLQQPFEHQVDADEDQCGGEEEERHEGQGVQRHYEHSGLEQDHHHGHRAVVEAGAEAEDGLVGRRRGGRQGGEAQ